MAESSKEIDAAFFLLRADNDGRVVKQWLRSQEAHRDSALVVNEDYTTNATVLPAGYALNAPI